jgi:hypothetical protein
VPAVLPATGGRVSPPPSQSGGGRTPAASDPSTRKPTSSEDPGGFANPIPKPEATPTVTVAIDLPKAPVKNAPQSHAEVLVATLILVVVLLEIGVVVQLFRRVSPAIAFVVAFGGAVAGATLYVVG